MPIYAYRITSHKYLIYSMNALKPAIATTACAGIRRMEVKLPQMLGYWAAGAQGQPTWVEPLRCQAATRERRDVRNMVMHPQLRGNAQWAENIYQLNKGVKLKLNESLAP